MWRVKFNLVYGLIRNGKNGHITQALKYERDVTQISLNLGQDCRKSIFFVDDSISCMAYPRNIDHVVFGQYDIATWFYSPYPEELVPTTSALLPKLFVCPRCFKYSINETAASGHQVVPFPRLFAD